MNREQRLALWVSEMQGTSRTTVSDVEAMLGERVALRILLGQLRELCHDAGRYNTLSDFVVDSEALVNNGLRILES